MTWHAPLLDYIIVPLSVVLFAAYHAWLFRVVKARPLSTAIGVAQSNRTGWVHAVMKHERSAILGVQTLRNNIMACTLIASASALAAVSIATFLSTVKISYVQEPLSSIVMGSTSDDAFLLKIFCLFVAFIASFFAQTQAIRFFNHVNFLISIPPFPRDPASTLTPSYVARLLSYADSFFIVGIRCSYLAIPAACWLLGPIPCLLATLLTLLAVHQGDFSADFLIQVGGGSRQGEEGRGVC